MRAINFRQLFFCLVIGVTIGKTYSQQQAPCGNTYGSETDEKNIITQMRYGNISDAVEAINQAKRTRGNTLACSEIVVSYATPNFTEPSLFEIENIWNTYHATKIATYDIQCPRIGRYENNAALGAYYAMQAGEFLDKEKLSAIADMMYDQQYATWNLDHVDQRNEGVFGYVNVAETNACNPGGVVGTSVSKLCTTLPKYCVNYTKGQFAGNNFSISAQDDLNNWFDGGMAYDHGWVGIQMIEAAINQTDPELKQKYRNSVELAGKYAIAEHCVKNHNYTVKLIWLLAELYAWTGDTIYKNELNYKLDKNLIPGILWDKNQDGFVDGTNSEILFSDLTTVAKTPGRMWDGHNSSSWYMAMNTWAMTEAYVAFRDRGDTARAKELKPYTIAMLDNLANEIVNQGVLDSDVLGIRDITYALLLGIWKVSQYENELHPNWEKAAWAMWNTGYFNVYNTHSVCVGLYLLVKSSTAYKPLAIREDFVLSTDKIYEKSKIEFYPNPSQQSLFLVNENFDIYEVLDLTGRMLTTGNLKNGLNEIFVGNLKKGSYIMQLLNTEQIIERFSFVKE